MKSISVTINLILAGLLVLMLASFGLPASGARAAQGPQPASTTAPSAEPELACSTGRSVQVSGTAVVNVTPDRVLIQLGVQSNGSTPQKVEALNTFTINRVIRDLTALGIPEKDIITDWYVIDPVYDNGDSLFIKGYRINNMIAINLRDISQVNRVITAALGAGANQVVSVEFYLSNLRAYRDQARELAMKAAREKAQALAAAAGAETGCVTNINENSWSSYNGGWYGRSRDLWTQNTMQNAAPAAGEPGALSDSGPLNLGQVSVRAEVSASFSLK